MHRFAVTLPASLASSITSLRVGHALKDNGTYWSPTLRACTLTTGEQTLYPTRYRDSDSHEAKRRIYPTFSAGCEPCNINYTSYQGQNDQHTLRKDVVGIRTQNSPCTNNIRGLLPMQPSLGGASWRLHSWTFLTAGIGTPHPAGTCSLHRK